MLELIVELNDRDVLDRAGREEDPRTRRDEDRESVGFHQSNDLTGNE